MSATLIFFFIISVLLAQAFNSGSIPESSAIQGQNFRHGDLENSLQKIELSLPEGSRLARLLRTTSKLSDLDVKRIYFGNWLRDYNQAIDVGALQVGINPEVLRLAVGTFAYAEFGYATGEFEVTRERLGVYRPEEHIDNPEGYAEGLDTRSLDKRLRGPVEAAEVAIDPETGMKNYIANERGGWATSAGYVRKSLLASIENGRKATQNLDTNALYEAERLLGQALHTLEDFTAHSNYCELVLIDMNYTNVFPHVGNHTLINLKGKSGVYPLVTGSFGASDFIHSFLGLAQDTLDQSAPSLQSLETGLNASIGAGKDSADSLKWYLGMLPSSTQTLIQSNIAGLKDINVSAASKPSSPGEAVKQAIDQFIKFFQNPPPNPFSTSPALASKTLSNITPAFKFQDSVMKAVDESLDKSSPMVQTFYQNLSATFSRFMLSLMQPVMVPLVENLKRSLLEVSLQFAEDDPAQWAVWRNASSTTPTHSQLSKDHFGIHLNAPAGRVALVIVNRIASKVIKAWGDEEANSDDTVKKIVDEALEVFHHPVLAKTDLQLQMRAVMENWVFELGSDVSKVMATLTSCSVRNGYNHLDKPGSAEGNVNCA